MKKVKYFRTLRENKNLTQCELAQKLGVGQNTVSNWENGIAKPDIETVVALSKIFETSIENVAKCFVRGA